jgi:cellulose synthase/poly-beta-1,6-N-acetylglucosamine synthase-like glycosyltransferase
MLTNFYMQSQQIKLQDPLYNSKWIIESSNETKTEPHTTNYRFEIALTRFFIAFTLVAWFAVSWQSGAILWERIQSGDGPAIAEQALFIFIIQGLIYGNFVYQFTRIGYLKRRLHHKPDSAQEREAIYDNDAPSLTILVPSYKEEISVVRRTLLSAALQDYPNRRIVLLIDDPANPKSPEDKMALIAARNLPNELQVIFDKAAAPFLEAKKEFAARVDKENFNVLVEAENLAGLYEQAALWLEEFAENYPFIDHGDYLLMDKVFKAAGFGYIARANALRQNESEFTLKQISREYNRLAALFNLTFTGFERKSYVNLSHESNKAMNLNSYIRLLGRSWNVVTRDDGDYLEEASAGEGVLNVPASDFLITLDADSLLVPEYALVLINYMLHEGNERIAVAQTPYNTIPNPASDLERIAGATTDIQYLIHQGFTNYNATYWVGANALLRVAALSDIKTTVQDRGFTHPVFIQDRTVIEDTESSIDLVACGWKLHNYQERLAFSATPHDFGSLLIQRRRWANGGLIILPKLVRYLLKRPSLPKMKEGFFRVHYLISIALVNIGLIIMLGHSFEKSITGIWLPLTAIPYFYLFARDLRYSGYRMKDIAAVYALNLLLIPINIGGVMKSVQQAITRKRIPFGRTPKVSGRTAAPGLYVAAEYALVAWWVAGAVNDFADGHNANAIFCLINAMMLTYAIKRFIGFAESWQDISLSLPRMKKVNLIKAQPITAT